MIKNIMPFKSTKMQNERLKKFDIIRYILEIVAIFSFQVLACFS